MGFKREPHSLPHLPNYCCREVQLVGRCPSDNTFVTLHTWCTRNIMAVNAHDKARGIYNY